MCCTSNTHVFISCRSSRVIPPPPPNDWRFLFCPWICHRRLLVGSGRYRTELKRCCIICSDCSPIAAAHADCASTVSPYPFNLFILAACTARTVLLYSNCILSIKKACFPWLLWCWNGSRGAIHIHSAVCFSPPLFCANSRIPIYILAVELNYCKHLCGPARHNRLAGTCIISVPPTGCKRKCTTVNSRHVRHQGLLETQWNGLLDSLQGLLEYLLNESLMTGIAVPVCCYVHIPGMTPIYLHIISI